MNHHQYNAIVTNARQGLPVSTRNRPRRGRLTRPALVIGLALLTVWAGVALVISKL